MRHIRFMSFLLTVCFMLVSPAAAFALPADSAADIPASPVFGKVIGIDPGHQETPDFRLEAIAPGSQRSKMRMTPGAFGIKSGVAEYQLVLLISNKLKTLLEGAGATVVMSRTSHEVSLSNVERAQMMNDAQVDCWVRVHCDYSSDRNKSGISMLSPSEEANAPIAENSLALAEAVLSATCLETGATRHPITLSAQQTAFYWSERPVVTVEAGLLSNSTEETLLTRDSYQAALAKGMFKGLEDFFQNG